MTTLYRPVLIETAEQAEALDPKTIVIEYTDAGEMWCAGLVEDYYPDDLFPEMGLRLVALVPVEAEEEYSTSRSRAKWSFDGVYASPDDLRSDGWSGAIETRYVTEWETA